jgi:hypothetical protein
MEGQPEKLAREKLARLLQVIRAFGFGLAADAASLEELLVEVLGPRSMLELGMARVVALGGDLQDLPRTLRAQVEAWPGERGARLLDWGSRAKELERRQEEWFEVLERQEHQLGD